MGSEFTNSLTMDFTGLIADDTLSKLKCDVCKKHLSHFPICISIDKKNICGRCSKSQESLTKNEVYEDLAQFVQFPCQYKKEGCNETAFPKDIPIHEERCVFRVIKCPTKHFTSCNWEGALPTALAHCQNKHNDLILKDGNFELDLTKSHKSEKLLEYESGVFIVAQKFYSINKLMECAIRYPGYGFDIKEVLCKINFKTPNRNVEVCCYTTRFDDDKVTEIFLDSLSDRSESSTVVEGKITLENHIDKLVINEQNDEFLALLKCSSCHRFALPPIYEVASKTPEQQNLVKCAKCKPPLVTFGSATPTAAILRNIALDNLANKLIFPCENEPNGCTFKSKPSQMRYHQFSCPRGSYNCPVGEFVACNWNGFGTEITAHIEETHAALILESSTVTERIQDVPNLSSVSTLKPDKKQPNALKVPNNFTFGSISFVQRNNVENMSCYIIKFSNRFFRLNSAQIEKEYHWAVQLIGPFEKDFMFELEIIDANRKKSSLITRQPCGSLMKKNDLFSTKNCCFSFNQIANLVCNSMITFNVKIYK
ncbi:uncharacterized protein LOC123008254 [Tribolium madens]|uniref:uncharacterized protein LOC123008254 n=1 Tax=Tribolium madens TaxID=41895 RepID=UPI001CF724E2|nr:uncharacterized protein LOC123008254 [Tribolium madens]